jgi:hypothetical protein
VFQTHHLTGRRTLKDPVQHRGALNILNYLFPGCRRRRHRGKRRATTSSALRAFQDRSRRDQERQAHRWCPQDRTLWKGQSGRTICRGHSTGTRWWLGQALSERTFGERRICRCRDARQRRNKSLRLGLRRESLGSGQRLRLEAGRERSPEEARSAGRIEEKRKAVGSRKNE